ncbi:MAG TPA: hypothetical protein VFK06_16820, partial [Candidatus Angelobacter sp.]|nr:hypothetical protein [Candidatus Angelobacter sp.]
NFQSALGRLAVHDGAIYEMLIGIRHVLEPLTLLDDPFIVKRVKEEMADASQVTYRSNGSILPNPSKRWSVREVAIYAVPASPERW